MATPSKEKPTAILLSDNASLGKAIRLNLQERLEIDLLPPAGWNGSSRPAESPDLLIVALCSNHSDPVGLLAEASLASRIGEIPMLIISARPVQIAPSKQICYLGFPFEIDRLRQKIEQMLHPAPSLEELPPAAMARVPIVGAVSSTTEMPASLQRSPECLTGECL